MLRVKEKRFAADDEIGMAYEIVKLLRAGVTVTVSDDRGGTGTYVLAIENTSELRENEVQRRLVSSQRGYMERDAYSTVAT